MDSLPPPSLPRRLGASLVNLTSISLLTGAVAWTQAEKFTPEGFTSGSGEPIWSITDRARLVEIAQDSWNRMQQIGDSQYVWTSGALIVVALAALGAAVLFAVLIPALFGSTLGHKIFGVGGVKNGQDNKANSLGRGSKNLDDSMVDLDSRLDGSIDLPKEQSAANPIDTAVTDPTGLGPADIKTGGSEGDPPAVFRPDSTALETGILATEPISSPEIQEGELLGPTPESDELSPQGLPDLGFRTMGQPVGQPTLSRTITALDDEAADMATMEDDQIDTESLPPPPLHRASNWDQPKAEPAPVWSPDSEAPIALEEPAPIVLEEVASLETESFQTESFKTESSESLLPQEGSVATLQEEAPSATATEPESLITEVHDTKLRDPEPDPAEPRWSEDWQSWIYWDPTHNHWLRHDAQAGTWVPLS